MLDSRCPEAVRCELHTAVADLALMHVEVALVRADRLTATERAMAGTVWGRPAHPWRFQLSVSASPMMMPSGPRRKQSR
jgi:hypothetical protein